MQTVPIPGYSFIVTAEHATDVIPRSCIELLTGLIASSETHQIYDPGTKAIGVELASRLESSLLLGTCTRLAIDLNRSLGSASLFSPPVFAASEGLKIDLINDHYAPFRCETQQLIRKQISAGNTVVHLSLHSFTKVFLGQRREVDLGVLFDDQRSRESAVARAWLRNLKRVLPDLTIRENEPYHGREDGHTTALRRQYPDSQYIGIEIELSQELDLELDAELYAKVIANSLLRTLTVPPSHS
ncbi:N-formylglutamate amidohydrolase [Pelagicoccus sp. SDUM812003]|uniref:N-formylglutamate amidohydrolase n=1 Tax=Pelagicoccus sp. SDUM812003 TaxID=3041267 RepID=UPI002810426A|nr:N-formylglutamate amidohydrolase [Pelagicoccus sp. SDUM812003]MDQ8201912.1 N-formylglutamate amidohydrolase [Pelagicoccus sp. SDUM812003]